MKGSIGAEMIYNCLQNHCVWGRGLTVPQDGRHTVRLCPAGDFVDAAIVRISRLPFNSSRVLQEEAQGGRRLRWSADWVPGAALACASLRGDPWYGARCAHASAAPVASAAGGRAGEWPITPFIALTPRSGAGDLTAAPIA
ncbi:hypothetical protein NDU88_005124 [Pleurodeles waltl]|uniref:Uncharacterized protein n=1 Tax=Pleurodeles waltl TaxID=8319 RepID=A0AAV7N4Y5_PLEWA|nr:hypothetical protein NDU88_005124 [Pleurodeles waltl]